MNEDIEEVILNNGYVPVRGRERIRRIALELEIPTNILETYLLEHMECRKLVRANGRIHMMIDFDEIPEESIRQFPSLTSWIAIPHAILLDYMDLRDVGPKILTMLVGSPASSPNGRIVEGEASQNAFFFTVNDITLVDPFFELNDFFIVAENGTLYQWKFAETITSRLQENRSAFSSSFVDLIPFERNVIEYRRLINDSGAAPQDIESAFNRVAAERTQILNTLRTVHRTLKLSHEQSGSQQVINSPPPRLGRFDSLEVSSGAFRIRTDMAPIYFSAAVQHVARAGQVTTSGGVPDDLIFETIPAVILAYLCLDSHVNELGYRTQVPDWKSVLDNETPLDSKLGRLFSFHREKNLLKARPDLKRTLQEYTELRNSLIHFEYEAWNVSIVDSQPISELYTRINLPAAIRYVNFVAKFVTLINENLAIPAPRWLSTQTGWLENVDLGFLGQ
ncbi:hypothetical protein [Alicyclobacillus ferrooxydans]|uniref:Apea-like HEPN domain-containing protein n=1 Tax=Alicyclobacillus ferrooxydans TaxID=471514 RepID=A0A0P9CC54_9BACL|nr:hypothetical protein [Alicyclobacillus ferrooxydans]KPV43146.1 hypothetical protein AN477_13720 [Alicyclobacillus ferrooxydans]